MDHKKRIAVVAVHGVGHQEPRSSAERAADLLRNQCKGYDWIEQSIVRIPVGAALADPESYKNDRAQYVSRKLKGAIHDDPDNREAKAEIPLDLEDMRERLLGYRPQGTDLTYETTCIQLRQPGGNECHVFEMFWGDLSRQQKKIIGTLIDFYQLLFFLTDLGGRVIQYVRATHARHRVWWRLLDWLHWLAHLILVLGIPILNLALLGLGVAVALSGYAAKFAVPDEGLALFPGLILTCLLAVSFVFREQKVRPQFWALTFIALFAALALPPVLAHFYPAGISRWFPMVPWLTMAGVIFLLMGPYERFKGGARICSIPILLAITFVFFRELKDSGWPVTWPDIFEACRASVSQVILWIHRPLWIGFAFLSLACWLVSEVAVRSLTPGSAEMDRARRAIVTAKLSLAVPATLVLAVDLGLWQLVVRGLDKLPGTLVESRQVTNAADTFELSVPPGTVYGLILFLLAALYAAWLFLPAALAENHPPHDASWLGTVLSIGFRKLKYSGWAVQFLIAVLLVLDGAFRWMPWHPNKSSPYDDLAVMVVGGALFALFAFRGAGKAIRIVLDIALDVANWLRHDPPEATPRARICARYVSLLKYIGGWRDSASNRPYDAIIIFSHSQGAVITADLLRFMKHGGETDLNRIFRRDPDSERLPVYLFTMGCPLRQLYGARFPDEYGWAMAPTPDDTGVDFWSNFYRSGDYVGRALWQPDCDQNGNYPCGSLDEKKRRERCIGSGAHTRYWDETAPEVAAELDRLIGVAAAKRPQDGILQPASRT